MRASKTPRVSRSDGLSPSERTVSSNFSTYSCAMLCSFIIDEVRPTNTSWPFELIPVPRKASTTDGCLVGFAAASGLNNSHDSRPLMSCESCERYDITSPLAVTPTSVKTAIGVLEVPLSGTYKKQGFRPAFSIIL